MLPGFRFLVAAVVLSISLLVFGLGAASLLRSAHEEFASLPARRAAPQSAFSQPPETPPTLAMLRLEPPENNPPAVAQVIAAAPAEPANAGTAVETDRAAESDKVAALNAASAPEAPQAEPAKMEIPAPGAVALAPAADSPPPAPETVAPEPAVTASIEAAPAPDQPATTLTDADTRLASSKIATLGGPPVTIEVPPAPKPVAKSATVKKAKKEKERPVKKRRVAERAAPVAAAPADPEPFGWQQPR